MSSSKKTKTNANVDHFASMVLLLTALSAAVEDNTAKPKDKKDKKDKKHMYKTPPIKHTGSGR
jgi:hypothetical protein